MKWFLILFLCICLAARKWIVANGVSSSSFRSAFHPANISYRIDCSESSKLKKRMYLHVDLLYSEFGNWTGSFLPIVEVAAFIASHSLPLDMDWNSDNVTAARISFIGPPRRPRKRAIHRVRRHLNTRSADTATPKTTMLRIQREWKDMIKSGVAFDWYRGIPLQQKNASSYIWIGPLTLRQWFVWHFSFTGIDPYTEISRIPEAAANPYRNGVYHGRLILPKTYPMNPPRIQLLTPNGRYAIGHDICLSVSNYHPETWQLSMWNIVSIVESLRYHMMTSNIQNEIGTIQPPVSFEKKQLFAEQSRRWKLSVRILGRDGDKRKNSVVFIDHNRMIQEGWIPSFTFQPTRESSIDHNIRSDVYTVAKRRRKPQSFQHAATRRTGRHSKKRLNGNTLINEHTVGTKNVPHIWSNINAATEIRRKPRTSRSAANRRKYRHNKKSLSSKGLSLLNYFYMNGCRFAFSYPWVAVGLLGLLFLYLNGAAKFI